MESHAKLLGHPVHPMLIVFPLGLLPTGVAFDIAYAVSNNPRWADISFWMISIGIIGALVAAIFGFVDLLAIPDNTRAKRIGLYHGIGNLVVVALFVVSWYLRSGTPPVPSNGAIILGVIAVAIALVTAWLGGELVNRLGVGVDDDAHLNAHSSIEEYGERQYGPA